MFAANLLTWYPEKLHYRWTGLTGYKYAAMLNRSWTVLCLVDRGSTRRSYKGGKLFEDSNVRRSQEWGLPGTLWFRSYWERCRTDLHTVCRVQLYQYSRYKSQCAERYISGALYTANRKSICASDSLWGNFTRERKKRCNNACLSGRYRFHA